MKRELDEDINWGKLFLKVIIVFAIILLIIWLFSKFVLNASENNDSNKTFEENLNQMYNVASKYFEDETKLPKEGSHTTITLKEMIDKGLIDTLKNGKTTCNTKSSYAKVSNKNEEYTLKVLLTCGSESNYISKIIKTIEKEESENKEETNDKTTPNNNNTSNTTTNSTNSNNSNNSQETKQETEKVVVTDYTTKEYKFCKIGTSNYYTVIYLNSNDANKGYKTSYTIKLNDLNNVSKLSVNKDNYFTTRTYYNKYKSNLENNFTIINGNSAKDIANNSNNFIKASLKSTNFNYKLTDIYEKDGSYYIDIEITITKTSKYNDIYNNEKINYVPIYFSINYANLNNCVTDTYANSNSYSSYYVVK